MLYEYTCPRCGWKGERLCKIAERDSQLCEQQIAATLPGQEELGICNEPLVREEISQTAALPNQWARWTGKGV